MDNEPEMENGDFELRDKNEKTPVRTPEFLDKDSEEE